MKIFRNNTAKAHKCHRVHSSGRQQWVAFHKRGIKESLNTENEKNRWSGNGLNSGVATAVSNTKSETSDVERDLGAEENSERGCYDTHDETVSNMSSCGADGERSSSMDVGTGQEPHQRGTYQEMHEYFQQRLRLALTTSSNSLARVASRRHLQMQLNENDLNGVLNTILCDNMNGVPSTHLHQIEVTTQDQHEQQSCFAQTFEGIASNPLYAYALDAWRILTASQVSVHFQNQDGIAFPSEIAVDALCELIVSAVSAGAMFGFEAVMNNKTEQLV